MARRGAWQRRVAGRHLPPYFSCIFSRMGTIMSNLGRLAGSSFMQIFISLQMWGDMPGGMVGRSPSRATWERRRAGQNQKPEPSPALEEAEPIIPLGGVGVGSPSVGALPCLPSLLPA